MGLSNRSAVCAQLCLTLCDPITHQAPLSLGFSRQEYWSGLPFSSAGDLPDPGVEPASFASPALGGRFFITSAIEEYIRLTKNISTATKELEMAGEPF